VLLFLFAHYVLVPCVWHRGWPEWANRYAVKCPQCGATDWVGVDFVSAEEEHKLEEQALGEQPDAPHDILE
jgi:hypothetical protein